MSTHVKTAEGLHIHFEALDEDFTLEELLPDDTAAQIRGLYKRIANGNTVVFCAKVSARKYGLELGTAYLGGCIYDSYEQFYNAENADFDALAAGAITEAKDTIRRLCSE